LQAGGTTLQLNGVVFTSADTGTAVGEGGVILRTTNGGNATAVEWVDQQIAGFSLQQNYPNPFNPTTRILFSVGTNGQASLQVFDLLGRKMATLLDEDKGPGTYAIGLDASSWPGGVYFCRIVSGKFSATRRMVLLK
jgi:hypothetical protein